MILCLFSFVELSISLLFVIGSVVILLVLYKSENSNYVTQYMIDVMSCHVMYDRCDVM